MIGPEGDQYVHLLVWSYLKSLVILIAAIEIYLSDQNDVRRIHKPHA